MENLNTLEWGFVANLRTVNILPVVVFLHNLSLEKEFNTDHTDRITANLSGAKIKLS